MQPPDPPASPPHDADDVVPSSRRTPESTSRPPHHRRTSRRSPSRNQGSPSLQPSVSATQSATLLAFLSAAMMASQRPSSSTSEPVSTRPTTVSSASTHPSTSDQPGSSVSSSDKGALPAESGAEQGAPDTDSGTASFNQEQLAAWLLQASSAATSFFGRCCHGASQPAQHEAHLPGSQSSVHSSTSQGHNFSCDVRAPSSASTVLPPASSPTPSDSRPPGWHQWSRLPTSSGTQPHPRSPHMRLHNTASSACSSASSARTADSNTTPRRPSPPSSPATASVDMPSDFAPESSQESSQASSSFFSMPLSDATLSNITLPCSSAHASAPFTLPPTGLFLIPEHPAQHIAAHVQNAGRSGSRPQPLQSPSAAGPHPRPHSTSAGPSSTASALAPRPSPHHQQCDAGPSSSASSMFPPSSAASTSRHQSLGAGSSSAAVSPAPSSGFYPSTSASTSGPPFLYPAPSLLPPSSFSHACASPAPAQHAAAPLMAPPPGAAPPPAALLAVPLVGLPPAVGPALPLVTQQQGLTRQAPGIEMRVVPSRPFPVQPATHRRTPNWYAIPHGPGLHPIITDDPAAWATYCLGQTCNAFAAKFKTYPLAVGHILSHFSHHLPAEGLCMNCFLFHPGTPCSAPYRDWQPFINRRTHAPCRLCNLPHHCTNPCYPPGPFPSLGGY